MRYVNGHCTAKHLTAILGIDVGQEIKSIGYTPGVTGWRIDGAGNFEGNDGTFRGEVGSTEFTAQLANFNGILCEFGLTVDGTIYLDNPPGVDPPAIGFFDVGPPGVTKRTVTGSTADDKVDSLISALSQYGLIIDSTT